MGKEDSYIIRNVAILPKEEIMSDKNVMVVEDNEKNRKLMRVILKAKGFNVIEATTGEEALGILRTRSPISSSWISSFPALMG